MRKSISKIAYAAFFWFGISFAQEAAPERLAVYVSGVSDAGVNKSLSGKLLLAMTRSGTYTEIGDPDSFQDELAKSGKRDLAFIVQAAKRYGSDYVCAVGITEVFGIHTITARLVKIASSKIAQTASTDRPLKSLEDIIAVSNELARQLGSNSAAAIVPPAATVPVPLAATAPMPLAATAPMPLAVAPSKPPAVSSTAPYAFLASGSFDQAPKPDATPAAVPLAAGPASAVVVDRVAAAQAAAKKQCAKTYNASEVLYNLKEGFPSQLKDCSTELAKNMAMSFIPGKKKPEPNSFMQQCAVDGIRNEIPDGFPNADRIVGSVDNFVQGLMNAASAGGAFDPKKLLSAVGSMNVEDLLSDVKRLASGPCVVNEPYEPADGYANRHNEDESYSEDESDESAVSFGIRAGLNFSHVYADINDKYQKSGDYGDIGGMQLGLVLDIAASDWFHVQPGLMYIQKGTESLTAHYIEFPLLLSLKLAAFRLGAGPYLGLCVDGDSDFFADIDIGLSTGMGFDIGIFYIGAFYDSGLTETRSHNGLNLSSYNRTLGFNLGVNL